jgi:hypothetical protein
MFHRVHGQRYPCGVIIIMDGRRVDPRWRVQRGDGDIWVQGPLLDEWHSACTHGLPRHPGLVVLKGLAKEGHRTGKWKVLNTIGRVTERVIGQLWRVWAGYARRIRKRLGEPSSGMNTSIILWRECLRIVLPRHYRSWVYQRHAHTVADGKRPGTRRPTHDMGYGRRLGMIGDGMTCGGTIAGLER